MMAKVLSNEHSRKEGKHPRAGVFWIAAPPQGGSARGKKGDGARGSFLFLATCPRRVAVIPTRAPRLLSALEAVKCYNEL